MNGFGLYETLRLVVPGALAVTILTAVLRLATGNGPLLANGPYRDVVDALQGATFLFASVIAGFLLYLIDLPTRARLYQGDPDNGVSLPTAKMAEVLAKSPHKHRSFSLYFTLSDSRMPAEMHRRVYFFGGLYRIYFDARILAAAGVALGGPLALTHAMTEHASRQLPSEYLVAAASVLIVVFLVVAVGESKHATSSMNGRRKKGEDGSWRGFVSRSAQGLTDLLGPFIFTAALGSASIAAALSLPHSQAWIAMALSAAAFGLWLATEMGPRKPVAKDELPSEPWRGTLLRLLWASPSPRAQYSQLERGAMDVALFAPAILGCAWAAHLQGRPATMVCAWAVLAVPATLIMSVRKHEQRLVNIYKDQVAWLEVHADQIVAVVDGKGPDWC